MGRKICILVGAVSFLACLAECRDFYIGMFKKNDSLVAQDRLFRERVPFRRVEARYLKAFHCKITYLHVADLLGGQGGPTVKIIRGGLLKKHIYLYIYSAYNKPLSVYIDIGCPNKNKIAPLKAPEATEAATEAASDAESEVTDEGATETNGAEAETTNEADAEVTHEGETEAADGAETEAAHEGETEAGNEAETEAGNEAETEAGNEAEPEAANEADAAEEK